VKGELPKNGVTVEKVEVNNIKNLVLSSAIGRRVEPGSY
jgi:hypothetical protein